MKPNDGELLIECDGHGSLHKAAHIAFKIMQSDRFKGYFDNLKQSWYFPKLDDTERLLRKTGFEDIQIYLSDQTIVYPDLESFMLFVKTVIMKPFLGYLFSAKKKEHILNAFLKEFEQSGREWSLDFVRLGILARKF